MGKKQKMVLKCVFDMIVRCFACLAMRLDHNAKNEVLAVESLVLIFHGVDEK